MGQLRLIYHADPASTLLRNAGRPPPPPSALISETADYAPTGGSEPIDPSGPGSFLRGYERLATRRAVVFPTRCGPTPVVGVAQWGQAHRFLPGLQAST